MQIIKQGQQGELIPCNFGAIGEQIGWKEWSLRFQGGIVS